MVGTIMIPIIPICIGIPEVPIAGALVWDLDTLDGGWDSPMEWVMADITEWVTADIMADITLIMDMVDITAVITPIMVMVDVTPAMVMADTPAMDTPAMARLPPTVMAGWIADNLTDIPGQPT